MQQHLVHYFFHFGFPYFLARTFWADQIWRAYLWMVATMLIDIDHLWANPIFKPDRLSIGYHTFHTWPFIMGYALLVFTKKPFRWIGIGLCLHMLTDFQDYFLWK